MAQHDEHLDIQTFLRWLRDNSEDAILDPNTKERAAFMPLKTVKEHLEENSSARLKELLRAVFSPNDPPVDPDTILKNYTQIFCTLVEIGKCHFIESFTCSSYGDSRLPYVDSAAPPDFPIDPTDPKFYENFCKKQWKFCVPELESPMTNKRFHQDLILPIVSKEVITASGSAMLYKIQLHGSYNRLSSQASRDGIRSEPLPNTYALKTYLTTEAKIYYTNEVAAFQRLKHTQDSGLIGFCGSYIQGNTYNIILEFADQGTLEQYFQITDPPVRGEDIMDFWKGMFETIKALQCIHQAGGKGPNEGPRILHGFHQDVKPANILVVSNQESSRYKWKFKVADLGLSHFKRVVGKQESVTANDAHGTRTYGAPECYRAEDEFLERAILQIKQSVDIWSLGGVFSEAAVWVANGYNGIREYRQSRKKETGQVGGFKDGDCFHDGTKVLQAVRKQHQDIIGILRKSDVITALVLSLIEDDMLVTPDEARLTATQLWHKSRTILGKAGKQVGSPGASTTDLPLEPPVRPTSSHPPPHPEGIHPISRNPTLRKGSTDSTPSDQGALRDVYPRTYRCLAEQHKTIEKCKTNIDRVENLLSLLSSAKNSLRDLDPRTARNYFNKARNVVDTIRSQIESENPNQMLEDLILEQHLNAWTGLTRCEIAIIDQARPPLSIESKETHLSKAEHYAKSALWAQQKLDPQSRTCKALELWERAIKEIQ